LYLASSREGMGVQPPEELEVHAEAAESVLRGVHVDVGHAGHDELVSAVNKKQIRVLV